LLFPLNYRLVYWFTKIGKKKLQISKYKIQKNFKVQILKGNDAFCALQTRCIIARDAIARWQTEIHVYCSVISRQPDASWRAFVTRAIYWLVCDEHIIKNNIVFA